MGQVAHYRMMEIAAGGVLQQSLDTNLRHVHHLRELATVPEAREDDLLGNRNANPPRRHRDHTDPRRPPVERIELLRLHEKIAKHTHYKNVRTTGYVYYSKKATADLKNFANTFTKTKTWEKLFLSHQMTTNNVSAESPQETSWE